MKAKVTRSGARIYKKNSNLSQVIGSLEIGDEIEIEAEYGRWVKLVEGGWLKAVYTEPTELEQGGASSWNDLEDRPFYENVSEAVLIDGYEWNGTSTPFGPEGLDAVVSSADFLATESVSIVFDGVSYECQKETWVEIDGDSSFEYTGFGNASLLGGSDTGEPFVLVSSDDGIWAKANESGDHAISMTAITSEVKTLDPKFLPEAEAVADAAGENPTAAEFNALLASLRAAGYLAE